MQDILELEPPKADGRVKYGPDPLNFADVRWPSTKKPWPMVMNIHGGFWRAAYDLTHAGHLCAALTKAGMATFNIEYRRVGDPGGSWPGTFEDIRNAYAYLQQNASSMGCDPAKIAVMGHSAGGHLAVCLAGHEQTATRVVSLAGVLDLRKAYELHLSSNAVVEFLGGTPEQMPDHYKEASPFELPVQAKQVVIAGSKDNVVPPDFSSRYAAEKKKRGETVEFVDIQDAGHFDVIDPRTKVFQIVLEQTRRLLS
ncbi:MAG TPA: alpha/beta hydrolase [Terriglobales bacterium]|nr:alpha/beta hydrolase [Terriglobales bacterium]